MKKGSGRNDMPAKESRPKRKRAKSRPKSNHRTGSYAQRLRGARSKKRAANKRRIRLAKAA